MTKVTVGGGSSVHLRGTIKPGLEDVIEGTNVTIDKTDPKNPIISSTGGGGSMVYPGAGIPLSTGSAWGTSITDNSADWNDALRIGATQTNTTAKSFNSGTFILKGATSGTTIFNAAATAGSTTITLPNFTGSVMTSGGTQSLAGHTYFTGSYELSLGTYSSPISAQYNVASSYIQNVVKSTGDNFTLLNPSGFQIALGNPGSKFLFIGPSAPTVGDVWTASNVDGTGYWAAPSGGGGGLTVGTSTITSGTNTKVLYNNSGVLGEYTVSGTGNVALTTSPVFTTPNIGTATGTASGNYSLASGGTATGTNTFAMGSNPFILTSGVTTGTGATAGIQNVFNSLTTGNGLDISSSSVSSGSIVKITGTGTAAASNTQKVLNVTTSGANGTSTQTTYGGYFSNTHTGTSATNVGLYATASGGTTNNAIETLGSIFVNTGNLTVNTSSGVNSLLVGGSAHIQMGSQFGTGIFLRNTLDAVTYQTATGIMVSGYSMSTTTPAIRLSTHLTNGATSGNITLVSLQNKNATSLFSFSTGTAVGRVLAIDPVYNITGGTSTVYGVDYNPTLTSMTGVTHVALRATEGQVVIGTTGTSSANDRVKINGIGTTTGKGLVVNNSSGSERFSVQDNGVINFSGSGGTAGQVLVSNGTSAAAWGTPTVNITGSNQRYQTQVVNISSSLVASGTGFAGLSNTSEYANKSVLSVDFVIVMIKNDGTAVVYGKLTSIFRKNNSGTWTADVPGTPTISDITQLSGFVGDINGGVPGITWTTPGTTSGTWQLGYTAAISSTTN
jgi:hypothetical protein